MCFAVINFSLPGVHLPSVITPGGYDLDIRRKRLDAEFKSYLIISFTGCTVADRDSIFFACYLNKLSGDRGTGHCSTHQVFMLIDSA